MSSHFLVVSRFFVHIYVGRKEEKGRELIWGERGWPFLNVDKADRAFCFIRFLLFHSTLSHTNTLHLMPIPSMIGGPAGRNVYYQNSMCCVPSACKGKYYAKGHDLVVVMVGRQWLWDERFFP